MWTIGDNRQQSCQGISRRGFPADRLPWRDGAEPAGARRGSGRRGQERKRPVILVWLWGGAQPARHLRPQARRAARLPGPFPRPSATNVPGNSGSASTCRSSRRWRISTRSSAHSITRRTTMGIAGTIGPDRQSRVWREGDAEYGARWSPASGGYRPPLSSFVAVGKDLHQGHRPIQGRGEGGQARLLLQPLPRGLRRREGRADFPTSPPRPEELTADRIDRRRAFFHAVDAAQKDLLATGDAGRRSRGATSRRSSLIASTGCEGGLRPRRRSRDRNARSLWPVPLRPVPACSRARLVETGVAVRPG